MKLRNPDPRELVQIIAEMFVVLAMIVMVFLLAITLVATV